MAMRMFTVPPGGLAGFSQMTAASRAALFPPGRGTGTRRRRGTSNGKRRATRRASGARKSTRKLKFGSPAWQKKYKVGKFAKRRK